MFLQFLDAKVIARTLERMADIFDKKYFKTEQSWSTLMNFFIEYLIDTILKNGTLLLSLFDKI